MSYNIVKKYKEEVVDALIERFEFDNVMSVPKIEKIVINRGMGEATTNSKVVELTYNQMARITGQKPVLTKSKKAISNFKIREDQVIGCKVTLRSAKMYDFLTKLIHIVLPKIRDFRGVPTNSFDGHGNYTLGLKEDNVFPEVNLDQMDKARGFDITIVTNTDVDEEARALLELIGFPFRKK
jgi:large subunit ribosomal protein L5